MNTNIQFNRNQNIPIFILAGGLGTRISEETAIKPKPMIEIGGYPILVHIMRYYYSYGFNDFVICAGYLSKMIKDYFKNYDLQYDHLEIDNRHIEIFTPENGNHINVFSNSNRALEKWRVRVLDTGRDAMTGSRVMQAINILEKRDGIKVNTFGLTYGDGLTNCNLDEELTYHTNHGKIATVLGVKPIARFGELDPDSNGLVTGFIEKPASKQAYINGGYFFFNHEIIKYLSSDPTCVLEQAPLQNIAKDKELHMYEHNNFWYCMDTLRDKMYLQELWDSDHCPWSPKS
jgi:glucose-1-phosphate cytidylyltransferase